MKIDDIIVSVCYMILLAIIYETRSIEIAVLFILVLSFNLYVSLYVRELNKKEQKKRMQMEQVFRQFIINSGHNPKDFEIDGHLL